MSLNITLKNHVPQTLIFTLEEFEKCLDYLKLNLKNMHTLIHLEFFKEKLILAFLLQSTSVSNCFIIIKTSMK